MLLLGNSIQFFKQAGATKLNPIGKIPTQHQLDLHSIIKAKNQPGFLVLAGQYKDLDLNLGRIEDSRG